MNSSSSYHWNDKEPSSDRFLKSEKGSAQNELLNEISAWWQRKDKEQEVISLAVSNVDDERYRTVSRSLIGRVNRMLQGIQEKEACLKEIQTWIKGLEIKSNARKDEAPQAKKAFKGLERAGLIRKIHGRSSLRCPEQLDDHPDLQWLYLTTFFDSLRRRTRALDTHE
jgi:hypothetical protein